MAKGTYYEYPNGEVHLLNFTPSNSDGKPLPRAEGKRKRQAYACKELRKLLRPGDTVYCILRHRAASGMLRRVSVVIAPRDKKYPIRNITMLAADAIDYRTHDRDTSIIVGGCGFDAGFQIVYALGRALWPKGTAKPHGTRNGEPDSDGGYALKQEWL